MKRLLSILMVFGVFLGSTGMSWGADFQKGLTAYKNGDYATALREWKPLAEQGDAHARVRIPLQTPNHLSICAKLLRQYK